jgi:putative membrane protein
VKIAEGPGRVRVVRYVNYIVYAILAVLGLGLSIANRDPVTVTLAPDFTAYGLPPSFSFDAPLYAVALACGALGFIVGAAREYLRERRHRRAAAAARREAALLKSEVQALKGKQKVDEDDEIIALTSR